jgi:hypothetical protein
MNETKQANETKHTPGPWTNSPSCHVYSPRGELVADAGESYTLAISTMEANARLIAAAPDLLAALYEATEWIYERNLYDGGTGLLPVVAIMRAAISKAETGE